MFCGVQYIVHLILARLQDSSPRLEAFSRYSGTPLKRTPMGQAKLSVLTGSPYFNTLKSGVSEKKARIHVFSTQILRLFVFTATKR